MLPSPRSEPPRLSRPRIDHAANTRAGTDHAAGDGAHTTAATTRPAPACTVDGPGTPTGSAADGQRDSVDGPGTPTSSIEQVLQLHGPEIFGWLLATLPTEADAADAFSLFSEDLWKSLARHAGRCSIRTWCFMLARHAVSRLLEARRAGRAVPLSEAPIKKLAAQIRDATASYLRTDVKQRVRSLRAELDPDDQTLLVLRVDKDLGWRDIAIVMLGDEVDDPELVRHAARLRKRFERVKLQLRELAARGGIVVGPARAP